MPHLSPRQLRLGLLDQGKTQQDVLDYINAVPDAVARIKLRSNGSTQDSLSVYILSSSRLLRLSAGIPTRLMKCGRDQPASEFFSSVTSKHDRRKAVFFMKKRPWLQKTMRW